MSGDAEGRKRWSLRCLLGIHKWRVHNLAGTERYRGCDRCGEVDDSWFRGAIGL